MKKVRGAFALLKSDKASWQAAALQVQIQTIALFGLDQSNRQTEEKQVKKIERDRAQSGEKPATPPLKPGGFLRGDQVVACLSS